MYANLALSIYLSMQTGPVVVSEETQPVPIVVELQSKGDDANVKVGKRIVVLAQVNEEEERDEPPVREPRDRERGDRDRGDREQGAERRVRERAEFQLRREDSPEGKRPEIVGRGKFGPEEYWKLLDQNKDGVIAPEELDERTRSMLRIDKPTKISELINHPPFGRTRGQVAREGDPREEPPLGFGQIDRRLREQAERIERLEGAVRGLHELVERTQRSGSGRDNPRVTATLRGSDRRDRPSRDPNPEARVRALEQALAQLKERAGGWENERSREMRRAVEAAADAERRALEAARDHSKVQASRMLEQVRSKREQAKKEHVQQREAVARQMRQAMERLEQNFKTADAQMEKAISDLEKKLSESNGEKRRELP